STIRESIRGLKDKYAVFKKGLLGKILWDLVPGDLRIQALSKLNIRSDTKILDVGCGSGDLLKKLEKIGCKKLVGIDPYLKENTIYSQNLKILSKDFLEVNDKFDLIMMHHSFEHMHNPKEIFLHIANILEDEGVCMIRIPVADSWACKHYGSDWVQLDAPRHFYLHTDISMEILCRYSNLELINKWRDSNELQFYGSEQYQKDIPLFDEKSYHVAKKKSIFSNSAIKKFKLRAKELNQANQGDQAVYLIRKKNNS
ncbi:MAG: class I SAM-dependent methyltransferase, partial [Raineya sp.]